MKANAMPEANRISVINNVFLSGIVSSFLLASRLRFACRLIFFRDFLFLNFGIVSRELNADFTGPERAKLVEVQANLLADGATTCYALDTNKITAMPYGI